VVEGRGKFTIYKNMNWQKLFKIRIDDCISDNTKKKAENVILTIAIASFIIHLSLIYLVNFGLIKVSIQTDLLGSPIAAIYTPFSFILLFEVYLLIYYLPRSFSTYIGKQYEIITLIIIRRLFKDLSSLDLSGAWFEKKYDLQFTYDIITSLILFILIFVFYKYCRKRYDNENNTSKIKTVLINFIKIKKRLAIFLVPVFLLLAIYSLTNWIITLIYPVNLHPTSFANVNNIFFEHFFNILIFADVLLLLYSLFLTDEFHKVMRNSGFIISTILLRLSFATKGLLNNVLIICAITFGVLITIIYNQFEKNKPQVDEEGYNN
jgi:hypothetical protein